MANGFFQDWPRIMRRTAYEAALPLLGGGSWVAWSWYKGLSFFEALSGFGIGYLFVLAAQGQMLRIAKNVRDENDADEFRNSFATLQQGLEVLREQRLAEAPIATPSDEHPSWVPPQVEFRDRVIASRSHGEDAFGTKAQFGQANALIEREFFYPAALISSIAFEQSLREAARYVPVDAKRPMSILADDLGRYLEDSILAKNMKALLRMRNKLVHDDSVARDMTKDQALEIVQSFRNGVDYLEYLLVEQGGKKSARNKIYSFTLR